MPVRAPSITVADGVGAELFFNGLSVVVAPSVHQVGVPYAWELSGQIPIVSWAQLRQWFGFKLPDEKAAEGRANRGGKKCGQWWHKFKGELTTLNLPALCETLGILGDVISADDGKRAVKCPWLHEHSEASEPWRSSDSGTVIFINQETKKFPGFKCLHAHCADRSLSTLLGWAEEQKPGIVDQHCATTRAWSPGKTGRDKRPQIPAPGQGQPIGEFAITVGKIIGATQTWFRLGDHVVTVRNP